MACNMLSDVARPVVKADRELYCIYLGCKGEIDILVCKKWPSIYDLDLKVAQLEERWTTLIFNKELTDFTP